MITTSTYLILNKQVNKKPLRFKYFIKYFLLLCNYCMSAEKSLNMNECGKMLKLNQEIFCLQEITALNNFATGGGLAHSVA